MQVFLTLLHPDAKIPTRATPGSAGFDIASVREYQIPPNEVCKVSTGISMKILRNTCYVRIAPRSGLTVTHRITTLAGVVDSDYEGEIIVVLHNFGDKTFVVEKGMRIAQLIFEEINLPDFFVEVPNEGNAGNNQPPLEAQRANFCFGSSGLVGFKGLLPVKNT